MATVRAMGAEKQQQGGRSTDDETIIEKVCRHLAEICKLLPAKNPEGRGFARAIFRLKGRLNFTDEVVEKAKASQKGGWLLRFSSSLKRMTRMEFWTLEHSIVVGLAVVVALQFFSVVLLLRGNGNGGVKRDVVVDVSAETPSEKLLKFTEQGETSFVEKVLKENPNLDVNRPLANGNKTALYLACEKGYADIAKLLLERKADAMICDAVNDRNRPMGYSALTVAALNGNVEVVKLLLAFGVDKESRDKGNRTALYAAAVNNQPKVVQCLCEAKANVNVYGPGGGTPLTAASYNGAVETVKVLLKYGNGVDIDMRNDSDNVCLNMSPLAHAVHKNHREIVEILCGAGADFKKAKIESGLEWLSPVEWASQKGHEDMVKVLRKYEALGR